MNDPEPLAAALERLETLNKTETAQFPRWMRWMIAHPITPKRIAALRTPNK